MRLLKLIVLCLFLLVSVISVFGQQEYVGRYDVYGGYSFLTTPSLNLFERGFHTQVGMNPKRWYSIGGDFSVFTGHSSLWPSMLSNETKAKLAPYMGMLPPGYSLYVPYNTTTFTFTVGPQLNLRKLKWATFFIHPSLGGLHQITTATPKDPIQNAIVNGLLGVSQKTSDTVLFLGVGGGLELNVQKHMSLRFTTDWVHTSLYNDLLATGQGNVRFSVGPSFHFGKNVEK